MARLFVLTVFVYPAVLVLLCLGAGLLIDCASGRFLPTSLLAAVGAAGLIALSQLSTYFAALAPATPYLMLAVAAVGLLLSRQRLAALLRRGGSTWGLLMVPVGAYLLAIAPVLASGRATFSGYLALADSAVHLIGADYLIHHGQHYSHLDLRNSYGQFINSYYNTSYPSGSDTLFGASALLLRLPLIWAFQPFNAVMLAIASGPAWLLARRIGLTPTWAAVAAFSATVPALVYGYELFGSVKEITALAMILTLGSLAVAHRRWLGGGPAGAIPFALVLAAGVSVLGVGFGAWAVGPVAILAVACVAELRAAAISVRRLWMTVGVAALVVAVAAWPTWVNVSSSVNVAEGVAATSNPGNLHSPLSWMQVFGVWLHGSYKQAPTGASLTVTHLFVAFAIAACALGALRLLASRCYALAGWLASMLVVWFVLTRSASTWVDAKTLMLTSPAVVLLVWAGLGTLIQWRPRARRRRAVGFAAAVAAVALVGAIVASDLAQYRSSNLAPTARYDELGSLNRRLTGRGPMLFTDFDEYSLYQLRGADVGGPSFVYPPAALAGSARGYGYPVQLDRVPPAALSSYPLIVTRRNPASSPPPAAYRLSWQGRYYQLWTRRPNAVAARAHAGLSTTRALACTRVSRLARIARTDHAQLVAAVSPELVRVPITHLHHPAGWGRQRTGWAMRRPGRINAGFSVPRSGVWDLWLAGQFMPSVGVSVDGRHLVTISGQLDGNSLVPETNRPVPVRLSAGRHTLSVSRAGFSGVPGNGGSAVLAGVYLTPAGTPARRLVDLNPNAGTGALCGRPLWWVELTSSKA